MVVKNTEATFRDLAIDLRRIINLPEGRVSKHFFVKFLGDFMEVLKANGGGHLIPEDLTEGSYHNDLYKMPESYLRETTLDLLEKTNMM